MRNDIGDLTTAAICAVFNIADIETLASLILTGFLLVVTVGRYALKLWKKIKDGKLTPEEKEEIKQDTAELIDDIKNIKERKDIGGNKEERPE